VPSPPKWKLRFALCGSIGVGNAGGIFRDERVDGGAQFLAIAERQAEFPEIGIRQGWQHRGVDLFGAKDFGGSAKPISCNQISIAASQSLVRA
jgi:hypothetical protein